ncbi:MAG: CHAT domain-containing protein [Cyanobacteria bacterium P01_H01_bin.26]
MAIGIILVSVPALGFQPEFISTTGQQPAMAAEAPDNPTLDNPIDVLMDRGRQAYAEQRFNDAVIAWSQAATLRPDSAATPSQPPQLSRALALSYLSAAYLKLSHWEPAQNSITQSLDLLPAMPASALEQQVTAQVHNTLGSLQFAQGQIQSALETWQYAGKLYARIDDNGTRHLNNLLNQVQAQQALGYYQQARRTLGVVEQHLPQQDRPLQIRGYQKLGQTYRLIGDLETSQTHLKTALDLAQEQERAPILLELGNTLQAQDDGPGAISLYQQAAATAASADIRVKARLNQLKVQTQTAGFPPDQLASLADDIATMQAGRGQIYAYINAAQSCLKLRSPHALQTAAQLLARAIQTSVALHDSHAEAYGRGYLGHVYEISQQWSEAQTLTQEAIEIAQAINATDITYQWQWQLGRLLKQQQQTELALQAYQDAFTNLQLIKQDLVSINQDLQFSFRDSVEPIYRDYVSLLLQPENTAQNKHASQPPPQHQTNRLQKARTVIESLQVAELDNFFRTACFKDQQVPLEDLQPDTAVIYPIILADRLEIIISLPGQALQQYTAPVTQTKLEQTLVNWRFQLEKPYTSPIGKKLGKELYTWLIEPIAPTLEQAGVQTLVFVLDGALRNTPMAALYDGEQYLVEHYAVALSPGLQLLGPRPLQATKVTALLAGLTQARHGFSALINVENELKTVDSLIDSHLLLDEDFTTDSLTQTVAESNRPIVHLATHGQFSSIAEDTFILAWDRRIPVNQLSALLKAGDLDRTDPIELLILSACETATGDSRAALGLAGMALQSGTRSTLASLWNLDDASGADFSRLFYQALKRPNTTKAKALQKAQLAFLKDPKYRPNYRHPSYWSAYVLVGNWL